MSRRAERRDPGEQEIMAALRYAGCSVEPLPGGTGRPDLLVGRAGRNYLLEVKSPAGPRGGGVRSGQRLSASQAEWHRAWRGQVSTVTSALEALAAVGLAQPGAD